MNESFDNKSVPTASEQEDLVLRVQKQLGRLEGDGATEKVTATVPINKARREARLIEVEVERSRTRVLFITDDEDLLIEGSVTQRHYLELTALFDEVHCLVLRRGRGTTGTTRPMRNLYLYQVFGRYQWLRIWHALQAAKHNLVFGGVVRPDCIVATSPYLPGLVALFLSRQLRRPFQVHLTHDPFSEEFAASEPHYRSLRRMLSRVLRRSTSVRVTSEQVKAALSRRFPKLSDVALLPRRYNFAAYTSSTPAFDVHEKYRDYSFIMLAEAEFAADGPLHDVFAALLPLLRNPRIGLIVVGHGRAKQLFLDKVRILGIERNVVFLDRANADLVSLYRTCDLFVEAGTSGESEEHILRAIGAALPLVAYQTELRHDLIGDGTAAFLVEERDSYALGRRANELLNEPSLRKRFMLRLEEIAAARLHEDPNEYLMALQASIESVFAVAGDTDAAA